MSSAAPSSAASSKPGLRTRTAAASSDSKKREVVIQGFEKRAGLGKRVAEELERGILKVACPRGEPLADEAYKAYKYQYKRLCTHFLRNSHLAQKLGRGELQAAEIAAMADEALMGDSQKSELQQFRQESLHEALAIEAEHSAHWTPSDQFECPKCQETKCVYIQIDTGFHSHDDNNKEPGITIRCTSCKHLWKEDEVEGGRMAAGSFVHEDELPKKAQEAASTGTAEQAASAARPSEGPAIWEDGKERLRSWLLPASSVIEWHAEEVAVSGTKGVIRALYELPA
eukprot:TRINITY_DN81568_c0_g1_i1.p1 TRINITY_DN81568_c0_g1~~TRINITY_DN81568_c0_g1_i1.p1  ORF type:complete len:285 (-),score=73.86 TRINITY_DN81568_c0_g1_i1:5-859(-)